MIKVLGGMVSVALDYSWNREFIFVNDIIVILIEVDNIG